MERTDIFRDDRDGEAFVERLGELASAGGATLYAWCLLPNHFHLVRNPGERGLAWLMRRLMTSHAVRFNLRCGRSGHLLQNHYKSMMNVILDEIAEKWGIAPPRVLGAHGSVGSSEHGGRSSCAAWARRAYRLRTWDACAR